MDDAVGAYLAICINFHARIEDGIVTHDYIVTNVYLRINPDVVSNHHVIRNIGKSTEVNICSHFCTCAHKGGLFYSFLNRLELLIHIQ